MNTLEERLRRFGVGVLVALVSVVILEMVTSLPMLTELSLFSLAWMLGLGWWFAFGRRAPLITFVNAPASTRRTASAPPLSASEKAGRDVANRALRRAGYNPTTMKARLLDVGMLVYTGGNRPAGVARDEAIRNDASHIRPFLRMEYPLAQAADETLRFELMDGTGRLVYEDEDSHTFQPGSNLIAPRTWLPMRDLPSNGRWSLRILVGQTPLAVHFLRWGEPPRNVRQAILKSDGEIADQKMIERLAEDRMSLDELLGDQSESSATQKTVGKQRLN